MLTRLRVRNFKGLESMDIELGNPVVFIGPNDSGKTSALQALALWDLGWRRWMERRGDSAPAERPGVAINRRDLTAVPVPSARELWWELKVRRILHDSGAQQTENVRVDVIVDGYTDSTEWTCGLEFDFANAENFYCRPLRTDAKGKERMPIPETSLLPPVALLGPMSGLAAQETRLLPGAINVRLGEGRTAEVLRNLCYQLQQEQANGDQQWDKLCANIAKLFGAQLDPPHLIIERGEIELTYRTRSGTRLNLSASGRGMQQTLLLLAFIALNPGSVVMLDEPDAHLEILRQRQIYELLSDASISNGTQVIMASHSEVVLNEAAERGSLVAFVGEPHRIKNSSQVAKSLRSIGFEDYYQAHITRFVLYLEGSTDLAILKAFAHLVDHPVEAHLQRPFVHYVGDRPNLAQQHYYGLREAVPELSGFALFDHIPKGKLRGDRSLVQQMWPRREIENYLLPTRTLIRFALSEVAAHSYGNLFQASDVERWRDAMTDAMTDQLPPRALRDESDSYWETAKISDDLLEPVFDRFYTRVQQPNKMRKANYHRLVEHLRPDEVHEDVIAVLDAINDAHPSA